MKFRIYVLLILTGLGFCSITIAQSQGDSLSCTTGVFHSYFLNGESISSSKAKILLLKNPKSSAYKKTSEEQKAFGIIFFASGVFCLGKGSYLFIQNEINNNYGDDPIPYLIAGVPLNILAVYFLNAHNKNLKKAILIYNRNNRTTSFLQKVSLNYGLVSNGIGLQLDF